MVMMYVRYPLSLRQVEGLLFERGIGYLPRDGAVLVELVRTMFAAEICGRHMGVHSDSRRC